MIVITVVYLNCRAAGEEVMMSDASFRALEDCCSPCASITLALACLVASASAAMALWSWAGSLTSLISTFSTLMFWCYVVMAMTKV